MLIPTAKSIQFSPAAIFFCLAFFFLISQAEFLTSQTVRHVHTAHPKATHYVAQRHPAGQSRGKTHAHRTVPHAQAASVSRRRRAHLQNAHLQNAHLQNAHLKNTHLTQRRRHATRSVVFAGTQEHQIAQVDSSVTEGSFQPLGNPAFDAKAAVQPVQAKVRQTIPIQPLIVPIPRIMPAALRGSHDVLVHQNIIADVEGLSRIQNDAQIREMLAEHLLVSLPVGNTLEVDPRLPANRRYCRPWTADFLSNMAHEHTALFQRPLQVNSAVRTVQFQQHLERINGNAAPATGDTASPHLTGATIDIAKKGMTSREIGWMRDYLGRLQDAGKLDVEEEFQQACFHISVYKTYEPTNRPSTMAPSGNPVAKADMPHLVATSSAPARVIRHSYSRRRHHHVSVGLLAARMQ